MIAVLGATIFSTATGVLIMHNKNVKEKTKKRQDISCSITLMIAIIGVLLWNDVLSNEAINKILDRMPTEINQGICYAIVGVGCMAVVASLQDVFTE